MSRGRLLAAAGVLALLGLACTRFPTQAYIRVKPAEVARGRAIAPHWHLKRPAAFARGEWVWDKWNVQDGRWNWSWRLPARGEGPDVEWEHRIAWSLWWPFPFLLAAPFILLAAIARFLLEEYARAFRH